LKYVFNIIPNQQNCQEVLINIYWKSMKFRYFLFILTSFLLLAGCQYISRDRAKIEPISQDRVTQQDKRDQPTSTEASVDKQDKAPTSVSTSLTPVLNQPNQRNSQVKTEEEKDPVPSVEIPELLVSFLDYPVPFAPQAPYGVWDALHQEACEEASMIMAKAYFKNESLNSHLMEQEILNLIKWEKENGYQIDVSAAEVIKILGEYFSLKAELVSEVTVENIKSQLRAGKLIIVPAAGRKLGNPYFRQPGPIYHMLLIRGFDEAKGEFIVNDPGTKRGEAYRYSYQKLILAVADWDHELGGDGMSELEMAQGRKVMIVVSKN